jgi:hypothetical protein
MIAWFIQLVDQATWLSPILMLSKKNMKLRICIDFWKLNVVMKKDFYQSYEIYSFMDHEFSKYDWIMITFKYRYTI